MVKDGDEIVPGLSVLDTPGHTPGHISLEVARRTDYRGRFHDERNRLI